MKINVTVLTLAALMAGLAGCDESLQLEWNDTLGTRHAAWTGIENRGTLTLINASPQTTLHQTVDAGSAVTFIVTSKMELDTTTSNLILTTRGKQYDAALALIDAPFMLPGIRNYRASFTPQNDTPSGVYTISSSLWDSGGGRQYLTLGKLNLTVEGDTAPAVVSDIVVSADSSPIRIGGVITLSFSANEALDIANTQAIFTISGEQHVQSVTLVPNTEYRYQTTLTVTDAVPDGTLEEVVVAAYDAAGNSERFTQSADLIIGKVAPPPPDTAPPAVSDIAVASDSTPIRLGDVVTLSFRANEALDIERTQAIFTISGEQRAQSVTLVPNTEYRYQATLTVTDAVADGTLEAVVVNAQDAAGNSERFTQSADLIIEKVAPPPPDTTPPAITNIAVSADSSPIRVGGVITLLFAANEPLDTAHTQAIFTIAGEQRAQSVTPVPNTEYRYQTTLTVTDAVPDGTLETVVVNAQDAAGNSGRFTHSADLIIEKVAPPPPDTAPPTIIVVSGTSDNADSTQAVAGDTVTLTFTTNEPIVLQGSNLTFVVANNSHGRDIERVADAANQYTSQLRVTDTMGAGILRVSVVLEDAAGNKSGAIDKETTLTIVPPPDTAPPVVVSVSATSDNADSTIAVPGNTVTLTITTDEPIAIGQSKLTFMVATSSHGANIREAADAANQYTAQLQVTETMGAGILRASLILEDASGNRSGAIVKDTAVTITPTESPTIVTITTTFDNQDGTIAEPSNTVTVVFTTNKPIVVGQSTLSFITADNTPHDRIISTVPNATNQYTAQLPVTDTMAAGNLRVSVVLADTDGSRTTPIIKDTGVAVRVPVVPTIEEPFYTGAIGNSVALLLTGASETANTILARQGSDAVIRFYRNLRIDPDEGGFDVVDFILYDLYRIFLEEQPEKMAEAIREGGIIIHPIVQNNMYFDWHYLEEKYPGKSVEELLVLYRQLVRFWGKKINRFKWYISVPPENRIFLQPPKNPHFTATERWVMRDLIQVDAEVEKVRVENVHLTLVEIYRDIVFPVFGVSFDFVFTDLWNIYREEQPQRAAGMTANDIPVHPISTNGLFFAWRVLEIDYPNKTKEERLLLFRQRARQGEIQIVIDH